MGIFVIYYVGINCTKNLVYYDSELYFIRCRNSILLFTKTCTEFVYKYILVLFVSTNRNLSNSRALI